MTVRSNPVLKVGVGLVLGLGLGAGCRMLGIPSPAPPALPGALLVLAMTAGYVATDRFMARAALARKFCGGPDGSTKGDPA